jgi:hypothetical protein
VDPYGFKGGGSSLAQNPYFNAAMATLLAIAAGQATSNPTTAPNIFDMLHTGG